MIMQRHIKIFCRVVMLLTLTAGVSAQSAHKTDLQTVLHQMDANAAKFQSARAEFVWEQYQKVVDETDTQKGTVYYRRNGKDIEMIANVREPAASDLLYKDGKVSMFNHKLNQVTQKETGKNRADVEGYLVLGFGGSGQDLLKSYDVTYQGEENIGEIHTGKLELIPKSARVKAYFPSILLWIDLDRGISVQQKLMQGEGDYRLARYSGIRLNEKISSDIFQLKTDSKTEFVTPRG